MALYAFDGTWQKPDENETNDTNVSLFHHLYQEQTDDKEFYVEGVGTRFDKVGHVVGGAAGFGGLMRIAEAYAFLCEEWAEGDQDIDIIGFSRGAALALSFANTVFRRGIRDPHDPDRVVEAKPKIRFLGLWDVVGSFGIPINIGVLRFQEINIGYDLSLAPNVEHCFHAMALDERRQTFVGTRVPKAHEVWFRGVHSDVGGGQSRTLSNLSLRWMLRKARAVGLPIPADSVTKLNGDLKDALGKPNSTQPSRGDKDPIKQGYRTLSPQDKFHYSLAPLDGCNNPPKGAFVETEAAEKKA